MPYKDPERTREVARKWHWANRERKREDKRRWDAANREHIKEYGRHRRGEESTYQRRWEESTPERVREQAYKHGTRRRAHKLGAATVEDVDRRLVLESHGAICGICGEAVDPLNFHVDHIVPLSRGGDHSYVNTQPAHPFCNNSKRDKLPEECCG